MKSSDLKCIDKSQIIILSRGFYIACDEWKEGGKLFGSS